MAFTKSKWFDVLMEFMAVFVAVLAAFGLSNWNDNRKDRIAEDKILQEIRHGLHADLEDFNINANGHEIANSAITYFSALAVNEERQKDSLFLYYLSLLGDYNTIINSTGYESLKSAGLEIVRNDSLRYNIVSLYDYDFQVIHKVEEDAHQFQYFKNYFEPVNDILGPQFIYNDKGSIIDFKLPLNLDATERQKFLNYLLQMRVGRVFRINKYKELIERTEAVIKEIDKELGDEYDFKGKNSILEQLEELNREHDNETVE